MRGLSCRQGGILKIHIGFAMVLLIQQNDLYMSYWLYGSPIFLVAWSQWHCFPHMVLKRDSMDIINLEIVLLPEHFVSIIVRGNT